MEKAARGSQVADVEERRMGLAAAILRERAPRGEDASGHRVAGAGQEAGDGVQPVAVLALTAPRDAAQQPDRVRVPRVVEHLARVAFLDQLARVEDADPVAHLGDHRQVVADEQHRGVELLAQGRDQVEHFGLDGRVKRRRRLVQDQQRRRDGQRHRDDRPLRHPAGQLVRVPPHDPARVRYLDLAQHLLGRLHRRSMRFAGDLEHLGDLRPHPDRRVERLPRLLVHHRDDAGPQVPQRRLAHRQRVQPVDADRPGAHPAVAGQVPHQRERDCGLAGPGLAHQPVGLAATDGERHVPQGEAVLVAYPVGDVQVRHGQGQRRVSRRRSGRVGGHALSTCSIESAMRLTATTSEARASAGNSVCHQ